MRPASLHASTCQKSLKLTVRWRIRRCEPIDQLEEAIHQRCSTRVGKYAAAPTTKKLELRPGHRLALRPDLACRAPSAQHPVPRERPR
eukprot:scaffold241153_cov28-Tisochrysis_lutea.AAC.2